MKMVDFSAIKNLKNPLKTW